MALTQIQTEIPICSCGSSDLKQLSIDKQNRKRVRCNSCGKKFFVNRNPRCVYCDGYTTKKGVQCGKLQYRCKDCHRSFNFGTREYALREHKPKKNLNMPSLAPLFRKPINADSIINVPCFLCERQNRLECDPNTCQKLTQFLIGEVKKWL